jgi:hypothetical protein
MTITIAYLDQNVVYLGSDSASTDDNNELVCRKGCSKSWVLEVRGLGNVLVGFSGMFATGMWIRYGFHWPSKKSSESIEEYLVRIVQPALQKSLQTRFILDVDERRTNWELLFAVPDHIFKIQACGNIEECLFAYAAIGDGAQIAEGVLYCSVDLPPWESMEKAFYVSSLHRASVKGPFHIHALTKNGICIDANENV